MPFGLGRPVRSTLTLLILVPHAPLPLEPAPRAYTSPTYTSQSALARPLPALKGRGHAEGGPHPLWIRPPSGGFFRLILARCASAYLRIMELGIMESVARKGCSVLHPLCPVSVISPLSGR